MSRPTEIRLRVEGGAGPGASRLRAALAEVLAEARETGMLEPDPDPPDGRPRGPVIDVDEHVEREGLPPASSPS